MFLYTKRKGRGRGLLCFQESQENRDRRCRKSSFNRTACRGDQSTTSNSESDTSLKHMGANGERWRDSSVREPHDIHHLEDVTTHNPVGKATSR